MQFSAVFPGQGSQSVGMLGELAGAYPQVEETFREASSLLDFDLWAVVRDGPAEQLNRTRFTQPAMLAAGIAAWRVWQARGGPQPQSMAGHSLGEFSALVAAQALDLAEATRLVEVRGAIMQDAVAEGVGAVAALLGLEAAVVAQVCTASGAGEVVEPVNFNAPNQIVIAGHAGAVERAMQNAREAGAKRTVLLPVSVPVHSSLMDSAAARFGEEIERLALRTPSVPVVQNVEARAYASLDEIRSALLRHLNSGVRWSDSVLEMRRGGSGVIVEFGPGKVLAGLCKRIERSLDAFAVESPPTLDKALEHLSGGT